jgi:hypothetical protein
MEDLTAAPPTETVYVEKEDSTAIAQPVNDLIRPRPNTDLKFQMELAKIPAPAAPPFNANEESYLELKVESVDTVGRTHQLAVRIPNSMSTEDWGILQRAAVAKSDIKNSWAKESIPTIINAIVFADRQGLSFEEGDVYIESGRLATTAKARWKRALATGKVTSVKVETVEDQGEPIEIPWKTYKESGVWKGKDLVTTVTIGVQGMSEPVVYKAKLAEWFVGSNPNWQKRPRYMLESNALGHAAERIVPGATTAEEAPPV